MLITNDREELVPLRPILRGHRRTAADAAVTIEIARDHTAMRPSVATVHGALITTQLIFGGGSVVGKLGVATFNPMLFALIREVVAGLLLLLWAAYCDGRQSIRRRRDCWLFLACGFFIFTNQAAFIVGDKLAGPVLASAWQPTQPVFTLVISWLIGWERLTIGKAVGIGLSVGGAAFMVTYGADLGGGSGTTEVVAGNVLFFFNCLGTSLYVITCKLVLARGYPPSTITAWSCEATRLERSDPIRSDPIRSGGPSCALTGARGIESRRCRPLWRSHDAHHRECSQLLLPRCEYRPSMTFRVLSTPLAAL